MPSLVITGFRRRSANSSKPFRESHTSMIRKPVSVGWEICSYIPGSGRASTPISSSIARNSLCVKPVTFIVITTISLLFFLILVSPFFIHLCFGLTPSSLAGAARNTEILASLRRKQRTVAELVVGLELHLRDAPRSAVERKREDVMPEHFPRFSA